MPQEVEHNNKKYKKTKLVEIEESKELFTKNFLDEMPSFREHCERAMTQFKQIRILKETMTKEEVTIQMDYAETGLYLTRMK